MKPNRLNILGIEYTIEYCDNPSEVDAFKRESLWGQVDYWTRTIRIYDNNRNIEDLWKTIFHEMLHAIAEALKLNIITCEDSDKEKHDEIDVLALALTDTLMRNNLLRV
jgi:hypothetical protein